MTPHESAGGRVLGSRNRDNGKGGRPLILAAFRAEWFKLVRRPANWVTIGLLLVLTVGLGYVIAYLVVAHAPSGGKGAAQLAAQMRDGLYPASVVKNSLTNASTLDGIFALILGVLIQGSENGWQTIKTTQTQLAGRLASVGGRLAALSLLILCTVIGIFLLNGVASTLIALADHHSIAFPAALDVAKGLGAEWLIFEALAVLGFGLATLFRQSAMAMGLGLGYVLIIETLVFSLLLQLGNGAKIIHDWFLVANANYLQQSFGQVITGVSINLNGLSAVGATHAVIALLLWTAAIAAISGMLVKVRDIT